MKKVLLSLFFACGALATLTSCSNPPAMIGLRMELTSIELAVDGSTTATVQIINPNLVAYNLVSATHKIILDGRTAGVLHITRATGVAPQSVAPQSGTIDLGKGAALARGAAAYRMESKFVVRVYGDATRDSKLSSSGTVVIK